MKSCYCWSGQHGEEELKGGGGRGCGWVALIEFLGIGKLRGDSIANWKDWCGGGRVLHSFCISDYLIIAVIIPRVNYSAKSFFGHFISMSGSNDDVGTLVLLCLHSFLYLSSCHYHLLCVWLLHVWLHEKTKRFSVIGSLEFILATEKHIWLRDDSNGGKPFLPCPKEDVFLFISRNLDQEKDGMLEIWDTIPDNNTWVPWLDHSWGKFSELW